MTLILIGAMLIIAGVVLAAVKTMRRGQMSEPPDGPVPEETRGTLEPSGRGRRLSLKADLPGILLIVLGVFLILAGA